MFFVSLTIKYWLLLGTIFFAPIIALPETVVSGKLPKHKALYRVSSLEPVSPGNPLGPAGPTSPFSTLGPVVTISPCNPWIPASPWGSVGPANPWTKIYLTSRLHSLNFFGLVHNHHYSYSYVFSFILYSMSKI